MTKDPGISSEISSTKKTKSVDNQAHLSIAIAVGGAMKQAGRWAGGKPDTWSSHRVAGVKGISKAVRSSASEPPIEKCYCGEIFVEKVRARELYPYPLRHRKVSIDERGELRPGEFLPKRATKVKWKWRAHHELALSLIVTAHLVCRTEGLVIRQADFALLLGVHRDTANRVLAELVQWGFVRAHARAKEVELENGGTGHHRKANRYTVTDLAIAYWEIKPVRARKSSRGVRSEKPTAKASVPAVLNPESTSHAEELATRAIDVSPAQPATEVPRETPQLDFNANRVKTRPAAFSEAPDRDRIQRPVALERDELDEWDYRRMIADWPDELRLGALSALERQRGGAQ